MPGNVLECATEPCAPESTVDRRKRVATENDMRYDALQSVWTGDLADAKRHLFNPEGFPRFMLTLEVWKPLIRAYFHWFSIPRSACTRVWEDIVDGLLKLPEGGERMDAEFQAWAFGCLCKFHLEDRRNEERARSERGGGYDPDRPSIAQTR